MQDLRFYQPILRLVERGFSPYSKNVRRILVLLIVLVNTAHARRKILFLVTGALSFSAAACRYIFAKVGFSLTDRIAVSGLAEIGAVAILSVLWISATFKATHYFKLDYAYVSEKMLPLFGFLNFFAFYAVTAAPMALYLAAISAPVFIFIYYKTIFIKRMNYHGKEFIYWNLYAVPADTLHFPVQDPEMLKKFKVTLAGETRDAIISSREADFISKPVKIYEGDRLMFSIGLPEIAFTGACTFEINVSTAGGPEERYFSHNLAPAAKVVDRAWKEFQVDLSVFKEKTVRLRFKTLFKGAGLANAYWEFPRIFNADKSFNTRMQSAGVENIIILVMDGMRADLLQQTIRASKRPLNMLEFFSSDSVHCAQAIAQNDWTNPSFASIFSGRYASYHQHFVSWPLRYRRPLPESLEWFPEILREQGYLTCAFSGYNEINPLYGFARGFDSFYNGENLQAIDPGETAALYGLRFLRENEGRKKFLFLHNFATHRPFVTRRPYRISSDPNFSSWFNPESYDSFIQTPYERFTEKDKEAIVDSYCSAIAQADLDASIIFDYLVASRQADRSLVILTTDHGYQLFDRGSFSSKVTSLYEEMVRVPFFMRVPKHMLKAGWPRMVDDLIEANVDIFPTILDAVGLKEEGASHGRSLLKLIRGEIEPREYAVSELFDTKSDTYMLAIRGKQHKLISMYKFDASRPFTFKTTQKLDHKFFDLAADPLEKNDIGGENRDILLKYYAIEQAFIAKNERI